MSGSNFGCARPDCDRHPQRGDTVYRVSPKGEEFVGLCEEHLAEPVDPEIRDLVRALEGKREP